MIFNEIDNFVHHFLFVDIYLGAGIQSVVLVEPHSAETPFINRNHCVCDIKSSEAIVETLKSNNRLFKHVQALAQIHLEDMVEFQGAVLIENLQLDDMLRLEGMAFYTHVPGLYNRKFCLMSPLVDF